LFCSIFNSDRLRVYLDWSHRDAFTWK